MFAGLEEFIAIQDASQGETKDSAKKDGIVKRNQAKARGGDKKEDNDDIGDRDVMAQGEGAGLDKMVQGEGAGLDGVEQGEGAGRQEQGQGGKGTNAEGAGWHELNRAESEDNGNNFGDFKAGAGAKSEDNRDDFGDFHQARTKAGDVKTESIDGDFHQD